MFHVKQIYYKTQTDGISAACLCWIWGVKEKDMDVEDKIKAPEFHLFSGFLR